MWLEFVDDRVASTCEDEDALAVSAIVSAFKVIYRRGPQNFACRWGIRGY